MPDESSFDKIYSDTSYFLNAIVTDYGQYRDFIQAVQQGKQAFSVTRRKLQRQIDTEWMDAIEQALPALDQVVRNPSKAIEEQEEVLPIEFSHNITSRSLRHLSQHTDYIKEIRDDVITPSKILNVFHEETVQTYENKFVNTLLRQLYLFVDKRYANLKAQGASEDSMKMDFSSEFKLAEGRGTIQLTMELAEPNDREAGSASPSERLERLHSIAAMYMNSDFVKSMGQNYVRPPIMRTNAIMKNKDLHQCLLLWQYIESYEKVGYIIAAEDTAEQPDEAYITELYSTLALQYLMFQYAMTGKACEAENAVLTSETAEPVEPSFRTEIKEIPAEDYNVWDTEYRRVVPVSQLAKKRRLSESELLIRAAVDLAFAADDYMEQQKRLRENARRRAEQSQAADRRKHAALLRAIAARNAQWVQNRSRKPEKKEKEN